MTHLEAQSYIMPFIEGKLPDSAQEDFVLHMKNCKNCHEELEIYYTLIVGMKRLDERQDGSMNLSADLERDLNKLSHRVRNRRGVKVSAFSIVFAALLVLGVIAYTGLLNKVYSYEQFTKRSEQGKYYYRDYLDDMILVEDNDVVQISEDIEADKSVTDYERIKGYIRLENDMKKLFKVGEDIGDEEASSD